MARTLSGDETMLIGDLRYMVQQVCREVEAAVRARKPVTYVVEPGRAGGEFKEGNSTVATYDGNIIQNALTGNAIDLSDLLLPTAPEPVSYQSDEIAKLMSGRLCLNCMYKKLLEEDSANMPLIDEVAFMVGKGMFYYDKYEKAEHCFNMILGKNPADRRALCAQSDVMMRLGRLEEAHNLADSVPKDSREYSHAVITKLSLFSTEKRYQDGLDLVEVELGKRPYDVDMIEEKISILRNLGRPEEALGLIDWHLAARPEVVAAEQDRYMKQKSASRRRPLSQMPDEVFDNLYPPFDTLYLLTTVEQKADTWRSFLYLYRSQVHSDMDNFEHALEDIDRSISLADKATLNTLLDEKVIILDRLERHEDIIACCEGFIDAWDINGAADYHRGFAFCDLSRYADAIKSFKSSLKKYPDDTTCMGQLAHALIHNDQYGEAKEITDKLLANDPDNWYANYTMGYALYGLGRHREALEIVDELIDADDEDTSSLKLKIEILESMDEP